MTKGPSGPTSSTPTEDSPPWTDLSKLGEYIVAQLGDERGDPGLLAHWIAHHLAERLSEAETAEAPERREAARSAAAELIPRLWNARAAWPRGWPPETAREFVDGVQAAQSRPDHEPHSSTPWLATLPELEALHRAETRIWAYGALLEMGATELRAALEAAPDSDRDQEDIASIRSQLRLYQAAVEWLAEHIAPAGDSTQRADRARVMEEALAAIAQQRAALVERALADARRGE